MATFSVVMEAIPLKEEEKQEEKQEEEQKQWSQAKKPLAFTAKSQDYTCCCHNGKHKTKDDIPPQVNSSVTKHSIQTMDRGHHCLLCWRGYNL